MSAELAPLRIGPPSAPPEQPEALVGRGAQLMRLSEQLHVRMLTLALALLAAASLFSIPLAQANRREHAGTLTFTICAVALIAAVVALTRREQVHRWLRRNTARQLVPALMAAAIVLADGPYSPSWWVALALLLTVSTIAAAPTTLVAGMLAASAYAAGILLRGVSLMPGGDGEYLTVLAGLLVNPTMAWALIASFTRFTLRLHRIARDAAAVPPNREPLRVPATVLSSAGSSLAPAERRADEPHPHAGRPADRRSATAQLSARQLEVAMLARDGLQQAEIAACLGISTRQVEHTLARARRRVGAATTAHLIALLVREGIAPAQEDRARAS